ncbi:MAG TPA: nitrous oxide-stimulated promoter family protein [Xylanibacter oryzae]|nr:nitrous oxide-stimulated promoter family protein [Xylanibacter oryzae]
MGKTDKDKQTIKYMVELYCKHKLKMNEISDEYNQLIEYAFARLEHCKYGENKPACKNCPTHCYKQEMRSKMRIVMKWAGPRMLLYLPLAAIRHLLNH